MTLFFTLVAVIHVFGLFAMLLALRRAPVAVEGDRGFQVIAEADEARAVLAAQTRTA